MQKRNEWLYDFGNNDIINRLMKENRILIDKR